MSAHRTALREAIAKATDEEGNIANRLAHAVLERDYGSTTRAGTWAEETAQQELALMAKQRVVDILKLALSRLPEAAETF